MSAEKPAWDDPSLRAQVETELTRFLRAHEEELGAISPDTHTISAALAEFLDGGKRMRGVLCYWGWRAAGRPLNEEITKAAAAMEFLQACALIHDDVMDGSDLRRGRPAIHRRFEAIHAQQGWSGSSERFGVAAAILIGDLCLAWADELLLEADWSLEQLDRAKPIYDTLRTELMVGQYMDVLGQARAADDADAALRVAIYKSGRYSVQRPLELGAALADGDPDLIRSLGEYGNALGQAFQLRDDLLGVFGDPQDTGKPAGDDLREGKRTVLVALAKASCTPENAQRLEAGLGDLMLTEDDVNALRRIIEDSGAPEQVEQLIEQRLQESLAALEQAPVPDDVRHVLASLARSMTHRTA